MSRLIFIHDCPVNSTSFQVFLLQEYLSLYRVQWTFCSFMGTVSLYGLLHYFKKSIVADLSYWPVYRSDLCISHTLYIG